LVRAGESGGIPVREQWGDAKMSQGSRGLYGDKLRRKQFG
jgi:hypothetical protein